MKSRIETIITQLVTFVNTTKTIKIVKCLSDNYLDCVGKIQCYNMFIKKQFDWFLNIRD